MEQPPARHRKDTPSDASQPYCGTDGHGARRAWLLEQFREELACQVEDAERRAVTGRGARELILTAAIDMVLDLGSLAEARWDEVAAEVAGVRDRIGSLTLKAILETALLGPEEIEAACLAAERGAADLVKTSTGFHPAGAPRSRRSGRWPRPWVTGSGSRPREGSATPPSPESSCGSERPVCGCRGAPGS